MDEPAFPGCAVPARLIGVIEGEQVDGKKRIRNDRLVAVAEANHMYANVTKLADLPGKWIKELQIFFENYQWVGSICAVGAGLIAKRYGAGIGRLFLAFPAIFHPHPSPWKGKESPDRLGWHPPWSVVCKRGCCRRCPRLLQACRVCNALLENSREPQCSRDNYRFPAAWLFVLVVLGISESVES
jgi:hypothetical protein